MSARILNRFARALSSALVGHALTVLLLAAADVRADEFEFFEKRIRSVLIERCYGCHSAAATKLKGGLHLDSATGMLKGGESGRPAIVPGDAERSLLVHAIRYGDEQLQMPPPDKGRLNEQQVADFVAWINAGAPDPRTNAAPSSLPTNSAATRTHWAFVPPKSHPLPSVRGRDWPKSPLDNFILERLERSGLKPAPRADRRTLIRRATFDLTGLPPASEEVEAFLQDKSPDPFPGLIDRLLASPHYGERWGRHWLDVARYADTKGYVYDREEKRFVHSDVYRDWVIRAFNDDLPYDRFLMLQLAADQLVAPDQHADIPAPDWAAALGKDSLAAMGFLTLGRRFLGVVHDIIDDRIDVVSRGMLGLTTGCARCHDHKFDPIPTRDYYSLYGIFANSSEQTVSLDDRPRAGAEFEKYLQGMKERQEKLESTFHKKREELAARLRAKAADYLAAVLDVANLPSEEFYAIMGPNDLNPIVVRQWEAYLYKSREKFDPIFAPWLAMAKLPVKDFASAAKSILDQLRTETNPAHRINPIILGALTASPPQSMPDVAVRYGAVFTEVEKEWREALKAATESKTSPPSAMPAERESIRQVLYGPSSPAQVRPGAIVDIEWFFDEGVRVELSKLQAEIDRWLIKSPGAPPHAVILADRPNPKNARVFIRGNPARKGEEVERQFLQVLSPAARQPFGRGSGRLELARAIASRDNPLTARVMVNRVWAHHFGAGLVSTLSDFGTRSAPASHPELLDWLACQFMDNGWSLKQLHRLMMLSSTYQMDSDLPQAPSEVARVDRATAGGANQTQEVSASQLDPENRLLWRMNRQRLDFETMRDSLLAVSGQLDLKTGGKATELFAAPLSHRRTVYGFIDRQFVPGTLRIFDYTNPDMHTPQRAETTVPQQALFFMNSKFALDRARALAARTEVTPSAEPAARIRHLYRLVYQREPSPQQLAAGLGFVALPEPEPPPAPAKPASSIWQYGFGEFDTTNQRLAKFEPLPHFTGSQWQGGPDWPDTKLGWVQLTAEGGHVGNDRQHAAVRRWVAPRNMVLAINGKIAHTEAPGDGIRAWIVSSRAGVLGSWTLHNDKADVNLPNVQVQAGDTIDFVVDLRDNLNSDMFNWAPKLRTTGSDETTEWDAKKEFSGPAEPIRPLGRWEKYSQVLLEANEFMFVD